MVDIKPRYLVMVTGSANNNKFYRQIPHGDTWTAEYGRIGASPQRRDYPMSQWDKKYNEKIKKGYVDQTDLVEDLIQVEKTKKSEYKEIENKVIAEIVERLQAMARKVISENYTISSNKVTQAMVDEAQDILTSLLTIDTVEKFNDTLLVLFTTIPRKMGNVRDFLARTDKDFSEIIQKEQDLLDVMKGQVVQKQVVDDAAEEDDTLYENTILEQLGLVFEECDANDIATIKASLGEISGKFHKAWRVTNLKTQQRFDEFVKLNKIKDKRLLFHGSTGKLYGYGIYFAPKARKSLGYTSLSGSYWAHGNSNSGFMALMDVAYGVPYDVYDFNSKYYDMNYDNLQRFKQGANCLHAHAGANLGGYSSLKNDEIIVYKEEQCTIKYLVELR